jgi:Ca-activated chloride channel family protein
MKKGEFPRFGRLAVPLIIMLILLLGSCSPAAGKLKIVEGSFYQSRGMYTEAIAAYLDALDYDEAAPYAEFGLGVIYLAMDETEAALGRFAAAETALKALGGEGHTELIYRIHYNTGFIRFTQGDFPAAAGEFTRALEADGSHIDAKRNLELSLLSLNREENTASAAVPLGQAGDGGGEILFDYIRQKEQDRWKSREWAEDTAVSGPDY